MSETRFDPVRIGIVSISDRASSGVYEDKGLPALKDWLGRALKNPVTFEARLIPDERERISATLIELVDAGCALVLTTGGTGPALRDVTPEAKPQPEFTAYGITNDDDPLNQAMKGLINSAAGQEHQIALLWKAIEQLSAAQGAACVPTDAQRRETFEADKLNQLVDR